MGTVHFFLLRSDGHLLETLHVGEATPERVLALLERTARALGVVPGEPVVKPQPPPPPPANPGDLRLHLVARYLESDGERPIVTRTGDWSALPGENWIVWNGEEVRRLLPGGEAAWSLPADLANRLMTWCYPPTEHNDPTDNRLGEAWLRGHAEGAGRARLSGFLEMEHWFYHRPDGRRVHAELTGYVAWREGRVRRFRLTTVSATYGPPSVRFGVAIREA